MSNHSNNSAENSLPQDRGAEMAVLSVILNQPERYMGEALAEGLDTEHFHGASQKALWGEFVKLYQAKQPIEYVSLTAQLMKEGRLETLGGPAWLTEMFTYVPTSAHWTAHVDILRDRLARRKAALLAEKLGGAALTEKSPEELAELVKSVSESILDTSKPTDGSKDAKQACDEFVAVLEDLASNKGGHMGIPTGMDDVDRLTGGLRPGELWVMCGPTSGGKSVLALQCVGSAIGQGKKVGIFSLEMGAEENIARLVSCSYGVDYGTLRNPTNLTQGDLKGIKRAVIELSGANMKVNDEGGLTIERIESLAQRWHDADGLDLLVIDYVQLVRTTRKGEARHEELAWIVGSMKQLAKRLKIPVVTASQLNDDGQLAKARSIGHDADVVLRIEDGGLYVMKNRNGEKHVTLPLKLNGPRQRFEPFNPEYR